MRRARGGARIERLAGLPAAALLLLATVAAAGPPATPPTAVPSSGPSGPAAQPRYRNPMDLAVTPDGTTLAVVCSGTDSLLLLDLPGGAIRREVAVGRRPWAVALDRAGTTAYVALRDDDAVAVVDLASGAVTRRLAVGPGPLDVALDREERRLFTANDVSGDVSVVDLDRGVETKRLRAGVRPRALALSGDGALLAVANLLDDLHRPAAQPVGQVTLIDTHRERVVERVALPGANVLQGIAATPDGAFLAPLVRPKNLVPLIQVAGGWTVTNGLARIVPTDPPPRVGADGEPPGGTRVEQLLLDSRGRHFADPSAVAVSPDGRTAFVSAAGADRLLVIDLQALRRLAGGPSAPAGSDPYLGDRLDLAGRFVRAALPTGSDPVAVAVAPGGRAVYVADRLSDAVTVIDAEGDRVAGRFSLEGPEEISPVRRGERLFYNAAATFAHQFTCATCHPDSAHDGLVYDISPDGLGRNLVDSKTLRGVRGTAPFKWNGHNPDLHTQCGPRAAKFINRSPGFTPEQLDDLVAYESQTKVEPNRNRSTDGRLTPLQAWGRKIFERTVDNTGEPIPEANRCSFCHSGPHFTDTRSFDVGTRSEHDDAGIFDTPGLNDLDDTAPYLHDGKALTLEEIWTVYNPDDRHGRANDLSKDELNALIEYLRTL